MKRVYILFLLISGFTGSVVGQISLDWLSHLESTDSQSIQEMVMDSQGNIYATGYFKGACDFDPGAGSTTFSTGASSSDRDGFVMKLDANGALIWAYAFGSGLDDRSYALAIDANDNIYIGGQFSGNVNFGFGTTPSATLSSNGSGSNDYDAFVVKMDSDGNTIWAKSLNGTGYTTVRAIAVDASNNVIVGGRFMNTIDLDPGTGSSIATSASMANSDGFYLSLDISGAFQWGHSFGDLWDDDVLALDITSNNDIIVGGSYQGPVDFDPGTNTVIAPQYGSKDAFFMQVDAAGNLVWLNTLGGAPQPDAVNSIAIDNSGAIVIGGYYGGSTDFDPGTGASTSTAAVDFDLFVAKYNQSGDYLWHNVTDNGGTQFETVNDLAIDDYGRIYAIGTFASLPMDFDPYVGEDYVSSVGGYDYFVWKMDGNGQHFWAEGFGSTANDEGRCILVTSDLSLILGGEFNSTVDFDPTTTVQNETSAGGYDGYFQKLAVCHNNNIVTETACDMTFSIDGLSMLTASGIYVDTIPSQTNDCDSIVTLDLTILNSSSSSITVQACDEYISPSGAIITTSGQFTDYIPNAMGCDSAITVTLTINTVDTTVTNSDPTLTANANGATYQWIDCDNGNSPIAGETSQSFLPSSSGNYAVEVTQNGCVGTSTCEPVISLSNELTDMGELEVYPNPFNEFIVVEGVNPKESMIQIHDASGRQVLSSRDYKINTVHLPVGVYVISIIGDGSEQRIKMIKY